MRENQIVREGRERQTDGYTQDQYSVRKTTSQGRWEQVRFQLCQIISYLSFWLRFWIRVINSRELENQNQKLKSKTHRLETLVADIKKAANQEGARLYCSRHVREKQDCVYQQMVAKILKFCFCQKIGRKKFFFYQQQFLILWYTHKSSSVGNLSQSH